MTTLRIRRPHCEHARCLTWKPTRLTVPRPTVPLVLPPLPPKEVRPAKIPYQGVRTFQGRDYTVDVPELIVPQCGNCKEVVFNYTAEEQIAKAL